MSRAFHSLTFVLTALGWLFLSIVSGAILFLTSAHGRGTPKILYDLHVHAALVGGLIQMIMGLWFAPSTGHHYPGTSRPLTYLAMNVGTLGLSIGFWSGNPYLIGGSGLLVLAAASTLFLHVPITSSPPLSSGLARWWYGVALVALLVGLVLGTGIGWQPLPPAQYGWAKAAHGHATVVGFVFLTMLGVVQAGWPELLGRPWASTPFLRLSSFMIPLGVVLLLAGLTSGDWWSQMGGGLCLGTGVMVITGSFLRTASRFSSPRPEAISSLLLAMGCLCLTVLCGIGLAVNALWTPPLVRIGQWHLMAYAHVFFLGFVLQGALGILTVFVPDVVSSMRAKSARKRRALHTELTERMERGCRFQRWAWNLGIAAMVAVVTLVWWLPLKSPAIPIGAWVSTVLLLLPCALFAVNLVQVLRRPAQT